jgi:succinyl-diaminopimelate desuccinylase
MASDRESWRAGSTRERQQLVDFLQGFVRTKSPNPPGDTRDAPSFITNYLARFALPHRVIAPQETMPNMVGTFEGGSPGRHLVLNGHIDCFPVGEGTGWTQEPWGGSIVDGKLYGRGVADMRTWVGESLPRLRTH